MTEADEDELLYDDVDDDEQGATNDAAAAAAAAEAPPAPTPAAADAGADAAVGAEGASAPTSAPAGTAAPASGGRDDSPAVYVSGLTWWTTDVDVETYCGEYGKVKSTTFFAEKSNGKSKGTVCVEFEDAAAARACLEKLPYRRIHGRDLTVRFAPAAAAKVGEGAPPVPSGKVPDTAWKGPVPNQGMMGMNPQMMGMNPQMMQQQQMMQRQMMQQQMMMMQRMSGGNMGGMGMMGMGGMGGMGAMGGMGPGAGAKRPRNN
jgi:hypothetical protein